MSSAAIQIDGNFSDWTDGSILTLTGNSSQDPGGIERTGRSPHGAGNLKKSHGVLRKGVIARYAFMKAYRLVYPTKLMARVLEVSRSGYYKWLTRGPSRREIQDSVLKRLISCAHKRSRGTYGPLRLQEELAAENQQVGRDHISRLRKEMGLKCIQQKKFKVTTDSKHHLPVAANLLAQEFSVSLPSTVWGTDITYIPTDEMYK